MGKCAKYGKIWMVRQGLGRGARYKGGGEAKEYISSPLRICGQCRLSSSSSLIQRCPCPNNARLSVADAGES